MAVMGVSTMTKESKLRNRNTRNQSVGATNGGTTCLDTNHKLEHRDYVRPFRPLKANRLFCYRLNTRFYL